MTHKTKPSAKFLTEALLFHPFSTSRGLAWRPSKLRRPLAAALSVVYFVTQVAFVQATETNFWAERRKAQLPLASEALPRVEHGLPSAVSPRLREALPKNLPSSIGDFLGALPLSYGTIRGVELPRGPRPKAIVLNIQDVHQNAEAQNNISRMVRGILDNGAADLLALEGSSGPIDLNQFHYFHDQDSVRLAADFLLKENAISGAAHAAFLARKPLPSIQGVDDASRHAANVDAYRRSVPLQKTAKANQRAREQDLAREKSSAFNPALLDFDNKVQGYRDGKISFGDYVKEVVIPAKTGIQKSLGRWTPASAGETDKKRSPRESINLFLRALAMEETLNFAAVERERTELLRQLTARLSNDQSDRLLRLSLAYKSGQIRYADFYGELKGLCSEAKIELTRFPAMDRYIQYVLAADGIDAEELQRDLHNLEKSRFQSLAKTPEEKNLLAESRRLYLEGKLLDFALTPDEWKEYSQLRSAEFGFRNEIQSHIENFAIRNPRSEMDLSSFESFYREAEARNISMAENLLKAMPSAKDGMPAAILVTGGFHSEGMADELKKAGVAVVSVIPKITKVDAAGGSAYLSVFTREKSPLEKLFEGQKLFLAQNPISPFAQFRAKLLIAARQIWLTGPGAGKKLRDADIARLIEPWDLGEIDFSIARGDVYAEGANGQKILAVDAQGNFVSESVQTETPATSSDRKFSRVFRELPQTLAAVLPWKLAFVRNAVDEFLGKDHSSQTPSQLFTRAVGLRRIQLFTWIGAGVGVILGAAYGQPFLAVLFIGLIAALALHLAAHALQIVLFPEAALTKPKDDILSRMTDLDFGSSEWTDIQETLGLDARPTQFPLLHSLFVGIFRELQLVLNPNHAPGRIVVYGCAGADISGFLLSTDATEGYFIDQKKIASDMLRFWLTFWDTIEEIPDQSYALEKFFAGYAGSYWGQGIDYVERNIIVELKAMGVQRKDIYVEQKNPDDPVTLRFRWSHSGRAADTKDYSIQFIQGDVTDPETFLDKLQHIRGRAHAYLQRSGFDAAEQAGNYFPSLITLLEPDGFVAFDPSYIRPDKSNGKVNIDAITTAVKGHRFVRHDIFSSPVGLAFSKRLRELLMEKKKWEGQPYDDDILGYGWNIVLLQRADPFFAEAALTVAPRKTSAMDQRTLLPHLQEAAIQAARMLTDDPNLPGVRIKLGYPTLTHDQSLYGPTVETFDIEALDKNAHQDFAMNECLIMRIREDSQNLTISTGRFWPCFVGYFIVTNPDSVSNNLVVAIHYPMLYSRSSKSTYKRYESEFQQIFLLTDEILRRYYHRRPSVRAVFLGNKGIASRAKRRIVGMLNSSFQTKVPLSQKFWGLLGEGAILKQRSKSMFSVTLRIDQGPDETEENLLGSIFPTPSLTATLFTGHWAWLKNLPARIVFGLAIPIQEAAHLLAANFLGVDFDRPRIGHFWSAVNIQDSNAPPKIRIALRLAGPAANLLLGLVFLTIAGNFFFDTAQLLTLHNLILFIALTNLALPAFDLFFSGLGFVFPSLRRGDFWETKTILRDGSEPAHRVEKTPDEFTRRRIVEILKNPARRPDPLAVAELVRQGVTVETILQTGETAGHERPAIGETLREIDALSPYLVRAVRRLEKEYPRHEFVFLGRDAELLYDAARLTFDADEPGKSTHAHLLPATRALLQNILYSVSAENTNRGNRDGKQAAAAQWLAEHGVTPGAKVVFVDTGFQGSAGDLLNRIAAEVGMADIYPTALVAESQHKYDFVHRIDFPFTPIEWFLMARALPRAFRAFNNEHRSSLFGPLFKVLWSANARRGLIAFALRTQPHFTAHYKFLREDNGLVEALPDATALPMVDFDSPNSRELTPEMFNPVAALAAQVHLAEILGRRSAPSDAPAISGNANAPLLRPAALSGLTLAVNRWLERGSGGKAGDPSSSAVNTAPWFEPLFAAGVTAVISGIAALAWFALMHAPPPFYADGATALVTGLLQSALFFGTWLWMHREGVYMPLTVSPATVDDAAEALAVHQASWEKFDLLEKGQPIVRLYDESKLRELIAQGNVFLAKANGRIVGVMFRVKLKTGGDPAALGKFTWQQISDPARISFRNPDTDSSVFYSIGRLPRDDLPPALKAVDIAGQLFRGAAAWIAREENPGERLITLSPSSFGKVTGEQYRAALAEAPPGHEAAAHYAYAAANPKTDPVYDFHGGKNRARLVILKNTVRPDSDISVSYDYGTAAEASASYKPSLLFFQFGTPGAPSRREALGKILRLGVVFFGPLALSWTLAPFLVAAGPVGAVASALLLTASAAWAYWSHREYNLARLLKRSLLPGKINRWIGRQENLPLASTRQDPFEEALAAAKSPGAVLSALANNLPADPSRVIPASAPIIAKRLKAAIARIEELMDAEGYVEIARHVPSRRDWVDDRPQHVKKAIELIKSKFSGQPGLYSKIVQSYMTEIPLSLSRSNKRPIIRVANHFEARSFENTSQLMRLFSNPENLEPLLKALSELRLFYSYRDFRGHLPLEAAGRNDLVFQIAPRIYVTPISHSFRRFIFLETNFSGSNIDTMLEIKMPGEDPWRHLLFQNGFDFPLEMTSRFGVNTVMAAPYFIIEANGDFRLYGRKLRFSREAPLLIIGYSYIDGLRLHDNFFRDENRQDSRRTLERIFPRNMALPVDEAVILYTLMVMKACHRMGWVTKDDGHIGNIKAVPGGKAIGVGDTEAYVKEHPIVAERMGERDIRETRDMLKTLGFDVPYERFNELLKLADVELDKLEETARQNRHLSLTAALLIPGEDLFMRSTSQPDGFASFADIINSAAQAIAAAPTEAKLAVLAIAVIALLVARTRFAANSFAGKSANVLLVLAVAAGGAVALQAPSLSLMSAFLLLPIFLLTVPLFFAEMLARTASAQKAVAAANPLAFAAEFWTGRGEMTIHPNNPEDNLRVMMTRVNDLDRQEISADEKARLMDELLRSSDLELGLKNGGVDRTVEHLAAMLGEGSTVVPVTEETPDLEGLVDAVADHYRAARGPVGVLAMQNISLKDRIDAIIREREITNVKTFLARDAFREQAAHPGGMKRYTFDLDRAKEGLLRLVSPFGLRVLRTANVDILNEHSIRGAVVVAIEEWLKQMPLSPADWDALRAIAEAIERSA